MKGLGWGSDQVKYHAWKIQRPVPSIVSGNPHETAQFLHSHNKHQTFWWQRNQNKLSCQCQKETQQESVRANRFCILPASLLSNCTLCRSKDNRWSSSYRKIARSLQCLHKKYTCRDWLKSLWNSATNTTTKKTTWWLSARGERRQSHLEKSLPWDSEVKTNVNSIAAKSWRYSTTLTLKA